MTHGHVFAQAKHPAVREATGKLESLLLSQRIRPCLDYFPKAVTKIQRFHFQPSNNEPRVGLLKSLSLSPRNTTLRNRKKDPEPTIHEDKFKSLP